MNTFFDNQWFYTLSTTLHTDTKHKKLVLKIFYASKKKVTDLNRFVSLVLTFNYNIMLSYSQNPTIKRHNFSIHVNVEIAMSWVNMGGMM
jgi:hypothetical protein